MTHGAYHPRYTPDGQIVRKGGGPDGRPLKRLNRDTPYYVRLNLGWFMILERLLDVPANREAGTNIPGCSGRAALIEKAFGCFLKIDTLARETGYCDVDDLLGDMIATFRDVQALPPGSCLRDVQAQPLLPPPVSDPSETSEGRSS